VPVGSTAGTGYQAPTHAVHSAMGQAPAMAAAHACVDGDPQEVRQADALVQPLAQLCAAAARGESQRVLERLEALRRHGLEEHPAILLVRQSDLHLS